MRAVLRELSARAPAVGSIAIVVSLALLAPSSLRADVIRVPEDHTSVYDALEAAVSGDSVLVSPGEHVETELLTIDAGVTLLGDGPRDDILIWVYEGLTLASGAESVRLENVVLAINSGSRVSPIHAENAQCELVGNLIVDGYFAGDIGSLISGLGGGIVLGNQFESGRAQCLYLRGDSPWTLEGNTIGPQCYLNGEAGTVLVSFPEVPSLMVRQNTFLGGDVLLDAQEFAFVNNIVSNTSLIGCPAEQAESVHHNLFAWIENSGTECLPNGGGEGNIWGVDPEFCDEDCDARLLPTSPAVGAGENGETLGAWPVGCGVTAVGDGNASTVQLHGRPFPNPSRGVTSLRIETADVTSVTILDATGRLVDRVDLRGPGQVITWDGLDAEGRDVGAGVYFVRIEREEMPPVHHRVVVY